jgi:hypothetical protein
MLIEHTPARRKRKSRPARMKRKSRFTKMMTNRNLRGRLKMTARKNRRRKRA